MNNRSIGIIGGFPLASANVGYQMALYLSKIGHPANLIIKESHLNEWRKLHPQEDPHLDPILKIIPYKRYDNNITNHFRQISILRKYDLIISVGGGGFWYLPYIGKPYVCYATGADLSELAAGKGYSGYKVKHAQRIFKNAKFIFHSPEFSHLEMIDRLKIKNKAPWRQFVDTYFWQASIIKKNKEEKDIKIYSTTNLKWISKFDGQILKSNDILFKGFRIFLDEGGIGKLYYRERGPDVNETRQLIVDLGISDYVIKLNESESIQEAKETMMKMDVIADQFGAGMFGLIALEAMSLGKPVIVYAPEECVKLSYPEELPPVLNAHTPKEIAKCLHLLQDNEKIYEYSISSRTWIEKYHSPENLARWYWSYIKNFI